MPDYTTDTREMKGATNATRECSPLMKKGKKKKLKAMPSIIIAFGKKDK